MKKLPFPGLFVLLLLLNSATAQPTPADSTELRSFIDGTIESYLEDNHIAGATIAIIQEGDTLLLEGYGFADLEERQPVNPDNTLFRLGSISKLFVWTAVMQQMEQGNLDLNTNINRYLEEFKIPKTYPEPITLKHLMTHTAGFEDRVIGLFAQDSSKLRPLGEILQEELPDRVRAPGQVSSYSNHGTALAAYIVEQVSGLRFMEYAERYILDPLGMNATTFQQPLPETLEAQLSKGYVYEHGEFKSKPFEYFPMAPVGAASATAGDLIPFMQTHLNLGHYQDTTILDSTTAQLMQSSAFRHTERMNPMRYGFFDMSQNGVTIYGHGGDTFWFHSILALFPEHDIGFFLSFNSEEGGSLTGKVLGSFVDRFFPGDTLKTDTLSLSKEYLQRFAGRYRSNRYSHERLTKVISLMNTQNVSVTEEGHLKTLRSGEGSIWVPVDSLVFKKIGGSGLIEFRENSSGFITHMYKKDEPYIAYHKIPAIASQQLHLSIILTGSFFFLLTIFYWPLVYFVKRNHRPSLAARQPLPVYIKITAWLNSFLMLAFYLGIAMTITGPESIVYGLAASVKVLLVLPLISLILTLAMSYLNIDIWKQKRSGIWSRISYSILTLVFWGCLWQLYYWNFLGFQY